MIDDMHQPANLWLVDVIEKIFDRLRAGDEPNFYIEIEDEMPVKIEIRLLKLGNLFEREELDS